MSNINKSHFGTIKWSWSYEICEVPEFYVIDEYCNIIPLPGFTLNVGRDWFHYFERTIAPKKFSWTAKWGEDNWYPADPQIAPFAWFPPWKDQ